MRCIVVADVASAKAAKGADAFDFADFTVLEASPHAVPKEKIRDIKV
ncbi:hypothetical protein [Steroidobacter sp.]|nr:hypothetical protein [Steroidobacter sp.]MBL8266130.1 hypothetical protein [Steroidobacter sp.]